MLTIVDEFLRGAGRFAAEAPARGRLRWLLLFVFLGGGAYGVVMSSLTGIGPGRYMQMVYVGLKVPLMLLATFLLCLPSFFVINTIAGLRDDFGHALRGVIGMQACMTLVLAALAPITGFVYVCGISYENAVLFSGVMFAIGTFTARIVGRRYYGLLIRRDPRHRMMLFFWVALYVFVGIQMGWVLRPFIGDPNAPVVFLREDAWGNPYVSIFRLLARLIHWRQ